MQDIFKICLCKYPILGVYKMHACFWIKWITCACVSAKLGRAVKRQKPNGILFYPPLNPLPRGDLSNSSIWSWG
ncbi:hypothetical protein KsCSTR_23410 [Candidatus Kuenenia stuttgartiensis]|uniref:Uncharacterized protein n=1 Tax=Kuenenia stuttgartiensis TaxID=174633 RepID=Q1Q3L1_KUEST|nr:hypothetical protein KsCSTR_23410 [Candidatus Kuenenia stuttgartiensis]CAJ74609.1 unknown protein [Candidatus Kuenenia stuttgartiensis]